jgi:ribonuclease Z
MIQVIFLGTSSMFPTRERNHSSILIRYDGDNFLFDCGEGTQRQLRIAKVSPMKIGKIFLTHWHGDHTLGLGGIIQSLSASGRKRKLKIFGPKGSSSYLANLMNSFSFIQNFEIEVSEISPRNVSKVYESERYIIYACDAKHGIPCLAFSFEEKPRRKINLEYTKKFGLVKHPLLGKLQRGKTIYWKGKKITPKQGTYLVLGKKITYICDTAYNKSLVKLAKGSDLLICEATYTREKENLAKEYMHLTSEQGARIAKASKSKRLLLTHFSQRYDDLEPLLQEARRIFKEVKLAQDFMRVDLR